MPNWCDNYVEITGPKKILDDIEAIVDEKNNEKEREHGLLNYRSVERRVGQECRSRWSASP